MWSARGWVSAELLTQPRMEAPSKTHIPCQTYFCQAPDFVFLYVCIALNLSHLPQSSLPFQPNFWKPKITDIFHALDRMKLKDWKYRTWYFWANKLRSKVCIFSKKCKSSIHVMKSSKRRRQFSCEPWQVWILRLAICNQGAKYGIKRASNIRIWHQERQQHQNVASKAAPTPKFGVKSSTNTKIWDQHQPAAHC